MLVSKSCSVVYATLLLEFLSCEAFPSFGWRVPNGDRVPCPAGASGCLPDKGQTQSMCFGLGHNTCLGGTLPLNSFGEALKAANYQWTRTLCVTDSDGDGRTNGEEMGDPCCLWEPYDTPSDYMASFVPTHPGMKDDLLAQYTRPSCDITAPKEKAVKVGLFNAGEEQRQVDFLIANYTIPSAVTTYVDIAWNFNDNSHNVFHAVFADAIVATPQNLHHFVVRGCERQFPPELHGKVVDRSAQDKYNCYQDFGGWAPGGSIVETPPWIGKPVGAGVGIVAFIVNVHFDNPRQTAGVVSRDGMRMFYTPDLRSESYKADNMMRISFNPFMKIPKGEKRTFMTRSCKLLVKDNRTQEPTKVNLFQVGYHAHLLGREMYAQVTYKNGTVIDLSRPNWHFDDQSKENLLPRHMTVESGDHIQSTCVFDSRGRATDTVIGLNTFDEMCWSTITFWPPHQVSCEGHAWQGTFNDTEDARQVQNTHPECSSSSVWSMASVSTGGMPVSPGKCPEQTAVSTDNVAKQSTAAPSMSGSQSDDKASGANSISLATALVVGSISLILLART